MKNLTSLLLTAFLLLTFYLGEAQQAKDSDRISVDVNVKPYFDRFVRLMEKNQIPVDYTKISAIELVPLLDNVRGYYGIGSKSVMLNFYFYFEPDATQQEMDDLVLITLAHEIGHSQGWVHIDEEVIGLMNPYSRFDLLIVRGSIGAEQYILNTYTHKLCN